MRAKHKRHLTEETREKTRDKNKIDKLVLESRAVEPDKSKALWQNHWTKRPKFYCCLMQRIASVINRR